LMVFSCGTGRMIALALPILDDRQVDDRTVE